MKYRVEIYNPDNKTWKPLHESSMYYATRQDMKHAEEDWKFCIFNCQDIDCRLISLTNDGIVYEVLRFKKGSR